MVTKKYILEVSTDADCETDDVHQAMDVAMGELANQLRRIDEGNSAFGIEVTSEDGDRVASLSYDYDPDEDFPQD